MREARISIVNTQRAVMQEKSQEAVLALARERIDKVAMDRPDIILLSELFANYPADNTRMAAEETAQTVPGAISEELSALARKHRVYIAFGLLRRKEKDLYNSLVLLDRKGKCVWIYDKITPMESEMEQWGVVPGEKPLAFKSDFGCIGATICFDINFMEIAQEYSRQDIELLLFSSAFPAGRLLDIWAIRYGFAIAGSTWYDHNRIIDCTGAIIGQTSDIMPYTTAVLNLNRRVIHMDGNLPKLEKMHNKYGGDVLIEDMRNEATCVITSLKKGLEAADLIKEFKVEKLPDYFDRCRNLRRKYGGI